MQMFHPDFLAQSSANYKRKLKAAIESDLSDSELMRMPDAPDGTEELLAATEAYAKEIDAHYSELKTANEFNLVRIVRVMLIKTLKYFQKPLIDITSTEKMAQLMRLIDMNMRVYRAKTSGLPFSGYSEMKIVVPNGYSAPSYYDLVERCHDVIDILYHASESDLDSLANLFTVYISAIDREEMPRIDYDYKANLKRVEKIVELQTSRSVEYFKASMGKNNTRLGDLISAFSQMDDVVHRTRQMVDAMRSMDPVNINRKTARINEMAGLMMDRMDGMDEALYIELEGRIRQSADVLYAVAKLLELFAGTYYRAMTVVGALDNGLEFLSKKL